MRPPNLKLLVHRPMVCGLLIIILAPLGVAGTLGYSIANRSVNSGAVQNYYQDPFWNSPILGNGTATVSGSISMPATSFGSGDTFSASLTQYIGFPLYHTYGVWNSLMFNGDASPMTFDFNVPVSMHSDVPRTLVQGSRIYLDSELGVTSASLTGTQSLSLSTYQHFQFDAPFDGLDDLVVDFTQWAQKMDLHLEIPTFPGLDSASVSASIPVSGEWSYPDYGLTATLGSNTSMGTAPPSLIAQPQENVFNIVSSGWLEGAWSASAELFTLAGHLMQESGVPNVMTAGLVLELLPDVGVELNAELALNIFRQDTVDLIVTGLPYIDIPDDLALGDHPEQYTLQGYLPYELAIESEYSLQPTGSLSVKAPGFGTNTLMEFDLCDTARVNSNLSDVDGEGPFIQGWAPFTMTISNFHVDPHTQLRELDTRLMGNANPIYISLNPPSGQPIGDNVTSGIYNIQLPEGAVPEPATASYIGLALGTVAYLLRRGRRRTG